MKIGLAPNENMVRKFAWTTADQTFDKPMAPGAVGDSFDLFNVVMILKLSLPKPVFLEKSREYFLLTRALWKSRRVEAAMAIADFPMRLGSHY